MEQAMFKQLEKIRGELRDVTRDRDMYLERLDQFVDKLEASDESINTAWMFMNRAIDEKNTMLAALYDLIVEKAQFITTNLDLDEESEEDKFVAIESLLEGLPQELINLFTTNHPHLVRPVVKEEVVVVSDEPTTWEEPPVGDDEPIEDTPEA